MLPPSSWALQVDWRELLAGLPHTDEHSWSSGKDLSLALHTLEPVPGSAWHQVRINVHRFKQRNAPVFFAACHFSPDPIPLFISIHSVISHCLSI